MKRCNNAYVRPTIRNGVQRISLTAPRRYAVARVHLELCKPRLRSLKRATSSCRALDPTEHRGMIDREPAL
jgi:hypothetical protein